MSYNIKIKSGIAFNLDDEHQLRQYQHLSKIPNVSAYLKRLISMDMAGGWTAQRAPSAETQNVEVDDNMMLSLI